MSFTVRGAVSVSAADYPATVTLPTGTVAGDLIVRVNQITSYFAPPTGWNYVAAGGLSAESFSVMWKVADAGDLAGIAVDDSDTTYQVFMSVAGDYVLVPGDWVEPYNGADALPFLHDSTNFPSNHFVATGPGTVTSSLTFDARAGMFAIYVAITTVSGADADVTIDRGTNAITARFSAGLDTAVINTETLTDTAPLTATARMAAVADGDAGSFGYYLLPLAGTGADTFASPTVISLPTDEDTFISPHITNRGLTIESGEIMYNIDNGDGTFNLVGYRSAWWSYTPARSGTVTIDTHLSMGYGYTALFLTTGSTVSGQTIVAYNDYDGSSVGASITHAVVGGTTYHLKVGTWTDDPVDPTNDSYYVLRVAGPSTDATHLVVNAPAFAVTAQALPYDPLPTNDDFANAKIVHLAVDNDTATSSSYDNTGYTVETGEPHTTVSPNVQRTAWWNYTPLHSGNATITSNGSTPGTGLDLDVELRVYAGSTVDSLTEIAGDKSINHIDGVAAVTFYAYAGHTYRIQLGDASGLTGSAGYVLTVQGPASVGSPTLAVDVPVAQVVVTGLVVAPVRLTTSNLIPAAGVVVPVARPTLSLTVVRGEPESIPITATFVVSHDGTTALATVTKTVTLAYATNVVTAAVPSDLTPGAYYWKVAIAYAGVTYFNYSYIPFTVADGATTAGTTPITWTVTSATPDPHLWFVNPAAGKPGDSIVAAGQGASASAVTINGVPATLASFTPVAATSATTGRTINPYTGTVDAEHFRAVFTVPDIGAPGGPVTITS